MSEAQRKARERLGGWLFGAVTRYFRGRRGAVAPILALSLVPIIGAMGMGAEASNWWLTQRSLQNAADSAALAAATDAGANFAASGGFGNLTAPTNCTTATTATTSWYCHAMATSGQYGLTSGSNNVTVTPVLMTSGCPTTTNTLANSGYCFKVTISKSIPIYLLGVVGYHGNANISGQNYQTVSSSAIARPSGPPIDYCLLTTGGNLTVNGGNNTNLIGCSTFANGNASCNSGNANNDYHGIADGYASGTSTCGATSVGGQTAQCDPYGNTPSQTINGNSVACSGANISGSVPSPPTSCTDSSLNSANNGSQTGNNKPGNLMAFPAGNVISATTIANALAANPTNPVIQVCGNAALGSGAAPTYTTSTQGGKTTYANTVPSCSTTINYSAAVNIQIVVYNGSLDMNGCTLETTSGGMTIMFAPTTGSTTCSTNCIPCSGLQACTTTSNNSASGEIDIAAPTSGTFSGIAILQSAKFSNTNSTCNGSGYSYLNWCAAGNSPSMKLQGAVYMPNGSFNFAGAVGKFDGNTGALNCVGMVAKSITVSGTTPMFNDFTAGVTSQCTAAGLTLPSAPGTHTYYAALVG